jgi:hypothetical protein
VGSNSFSYSATLSASNTLQVRVMDAASNAGTAKSQAYMLDASPSTITVSTVGLSADTGTSTTDLTTKTAAQTISATLSTALSSGDVLSGSVDGGTTWTDITNQVNTTTINWSGATLSGSNNIVFKITDVAGNVGNNTGSTAYVLDTGLPSPVTDLAVNSVLGTTRTTGDTTPTISGLAEPYSTVELFEGGVLLGTITADINGNWSITSSVLTSNASSTTPHTLTVKVTDTSGNASATTSTVNLTIDLNLDSTAPTVTNASASYTATTNILVLTGTLYNTLLEPTETANTDIKGRLDWTKLSWDINGDNGTNNVSFALGDIDSAKVTSAGILTITLTAAKASALEAFVGYGATVAVDTLDISAGFAKDLAGNVATTDAVANAVLTLPTPAEAAAAALLLFDSYDSSYAIAASNFSNLQSGMVSTFVTTTANANTTFQTATDFLAAAQAMFDDASAQKNAAIALGAAAAGTPEATDDAGAAQRVAISNTHLAAATLNLSNAQRVFANMQIYKNSFNGQLYYAAAAANVATGQADAAILNSLFINDVLAAGALTFADGYFANKTNLDTVLVGHTGAGAQTLTLGTQYSSTTALNLYGSAEAGALAYNTAAVTGPVSVTLSTTAGAITLTAGNGDTNYTASSLAGAPSFNGGNGNNNINLLVITGAITVNSGNGNNTMTTETTGAAGAITLNVGTGNNVLSAKTDGGAITINTGTGSETIKAFAGTGAVTVNVATAGTGSASDIIIVDTNTYGSTAALGITIVNGSNGTHTIRSSTYNSAITINTHDANDYVSATTGGGIVVVNTGAGNDTIYVASGTAGATINGGLGTNSITLGAHTTTADTINATTAHATLVTGATIGAVLPDVYQFGAVLPASLISTAETVIAGTTAAAISATGILSFTLNGNAFHTGAVFAEEVLTFLKAQATTHALVTSYDDGVNQWLFSATSASAGHYLQLIDSHDALFAGATTTAAAHKILLA